MKNKSEDRVFKILFPVREKRSSAVSLFPFRQILESFKTRLEKFYLENHNKLNNLKEISYGFVDGDLYYIKKHKKKRNDIKVTMEELEALNDQKLLAWITVYTDGEKRKENGINSFSRELTTEERNEYIKFLYENFKIKDK